MRIAGENHAGMQDLKPGKDLPNEEECAKPGSPGSQEKKARLIVMREPPAGGLESGATRKQNGRRHP